MQVVKPSAEILTGLDNIGLSQRIELCGRICYKSESKITDTSAVKFVERIRKHGHDSVMEMGVFTLDVTLTHQTERLTDFLILETKYLHILTCDYGMIITASVRSWYEFILNNRGNPIVESIRMYLQARNPIFFSGIKGAEKVNKPTGIEVSKIRLSDIDNFLPENRAKHRHVAVRFIINRAVSHEIVRHRPCSFLQESQRYCRYSDDKFGNEVTFIKPMFFEERSHQYKTWFLSMDQAECSYIDLLQTSTPQAARTVLPSSCKTELILFASLEQWRHIFKMRCQKSAEPSMREVMIPLYEEMKWIFPEVAYE